MKKKSFIFLLVIFIAITTKAQVTIGSLDAPAKGAVLELKSDSLGLLLTRVALSKLNLPDPLSAHVKGMVVYNTTTDLANNLQPGLYYDDGTQWISVSENGGGSELSNISLSDPVTVNAGDTLLVYKNNQWVVGTFPTISTASEPVLKTDVVTDVDNYVIGAGDGDYFLLLQPIKTQSTLNLPTGANVPIGKKIYVSNPTATTNVVSINPEPLNDSFKQIGGLGGPTGMLLYVGTLNNLYPNGVWEWVTGY